MDPEQKEQVLALWVQKSRDYLYSRPDIDKNQVDATIQKFIPVAHDPILNEKYGRYVDPMLTARDGSGMSIGGRISTVFSGGHWKSIHTHLKEQDAEYDKVLNNPDSSITDRLAAAGKNLFGVTGLVVQGVTGTTDQAAQEHGMAVQAKKEFGDLDRTNAIKAARMSDQYTQDLEAGKNILTDKDERGMWTETVGNTTLLDKSLVNKKTTLWQAQGYLNALKNGDISATAELIARKALGGLPGVTTDDIDINTKDPEQVAKRSALLSAIAAEEDKRKILSGVSGAAGTVAGMVLTGGIGSTATGVAKTAQVANAAETALAAAKTEGASAELIASLSAKAAQAALQQTAAETAAHRLGLSLYATAENYKHDPRQLGFINRAASILTDTGTMLAADRLANLASSRITDYAKENAKSLGTIGTFGAHTLAGTIQGTAFSAAQTAMQGGDPTRDLGESLLVNAIIGGASHISGVVANTATQRLVAQRAVNGIKGLAGALSDIDSRPNETPEVKEAAKNLIFSRLSGGDAVTEKWLRDKVSAYNGVNTAVAKKTASDQQAASLETNGLTEAAKATRATADAAFQQEVKTALTPAQRDLTGVPPEQLTADEWQRAGGGDVQAHKAAITDALAAGKPVDAEAADTYGITPPENYDKHGFLYAPGKSAQASAEVIATHLNAEDAVKQSPVGMEGLAADLKAREAAGKAASQAPEEHAVTEGQDAASETAKVQPSETVSEPAKTAPETAIPTDSKAAPVAAEPDMKAEAAAHGLTYVGQAGDHVFRNSKGKVIHVPLDASPEDRAQLLSGRKIKPSEATTPEPISPADTPDATGRTGDQGQGPGVVPPAPVPTQVHETATSNERKVIDNGEIQRSSETGGHDQKRASGGQSGSAEDQASSGGKEIAKAGGGGKSKAPAELPSTDTKWIDDTHTVIVDTLKEEGLDPAITSRDAVAKVLATVQGVAKGHPQEVFDNALIRIQKELINNILETGNPLKVITRAGKEENFSARDVARSVRSNFYARAENASGVSSEGLDIILANTPSQRAGNEVRETALDKLRLRTHEGLDSLTVRLLNEKPDYIQDWLKGRKKTEDKTPAEQIRESASRVLDDVIRSLTGGKEGVLFAKKVGGRPTQFEKNPAFRKEVQTNVFDALREYGEGLAREIGGGNKAEGIREIMMDSPGDAADKNGLTAPDRRYMEILAQRAVDLTPDAVSKLLPDHLQSRVNERAKKYQLARGSRAALDAIASDSKSDPLMRQLARALSKTGVNLDIHADPTLAGRGKDGQFNETISVNPFASEPAFQRAVIHEQIHGILSRKTNAFLDGSHADLSAADRTALASLDRLRQHSLDQANVPQVIRDIADEKDTSIQQAMFARALDTDPSMRKFYGLLNLHEFASETATRGDFQDFLSTIKAPSEAMGFGGTLWAKVKGFLRTLTLGGQRVDDNSVLAQAFDRTLRLAQSERSPGGGQVDKINLERINKGIYHADSLPTYLQQEGDSTARSGDENDLAAATQVARGSHEAASQAGAREFADESDRAKRQAGLFKVANQVRPEEEKALASWARDNGKLIDAENFEREWKASGGQGGQEHQVYFDPESQRWVKANDLSFHSTWLEYFHRLTLHNALFPDAPLQFEGLMQTDNGLKAVVSQPDIQATRGATRPEVEAYMAERGFRRAKGDDYINGDLGIKVEDLHDENAVMTPAGDVVVFDPVPYLDVATKTARLREAATHQTVLDTRVDTPTFREDASHQASFLNGWAAQYGYEDARAMLNDGEQGVERFRAGAALYRVLNPRPEIPDKALASFADKEDEQEHVEKTIAATRSLLENVNKTRQANAADAPGIDLGKPIDAIVKEAFVAGRPETDKLAADLRQATLLGDREAQSVAKAILAHYDAVSQSSAANRAYNQIVNGNGKTGAAAGPGARVTISAKNLRANMTGALAQAGAKVKDADYKAAINWLRYKLQDNLVDLDNIQRAIVKEKGLSNLPDSMNAYQEAELSKLRRAEQQHQLQDVEFPAFVKDIQDRHLTSDEVHEFLQARHAPERNAYIASINDKMPDVGSGVTDLDSAATMARFAVEGKTADLESVAGKLDAIMARNLKARLDAGLIDQETYDKLSTFYKHYVPLKGRPGNIDEDDRDSSMNVGGGGYALSGGEFKRALGRYDEAGDITSQIFSDASETITRVEKAQVGQALLAAMREHPDIGWKIAEPRFTRTTDSAGKVRDVIDRSWMQLPEVYPTKENGKTVFLEFENKRLAMALKGAGPETNNIVMRTLRAWTTFQTSINTSFNPEFVISNFARDWQEVGINLSAEQTASIRKDVLKDTVNGKAMKGVWAALRGNNTNDPWAKEYQEMRNAGGHISFAGPMDAAAFEKKMNGLTADQTTLAARSKEIFGVFVHQVERVNATVENAIRLSTFHHAKLAGMTEKQSAHLAAGVSINFTRKGEWGNVMNTLYLFSNASIQSSAKMMLSVGRSPAVRKMVYGIIAAGFGIDLLNRIWGGEDKDGIPYYDKIPDTVKNRNFVFMTGKQGRYIKIPLFYGYNVAYTAGRSLAAALPKEVGGGGASPWKAGSNVALTTVDNFNPLGGSSSLLATLIPTAAKPLYEVTVNRDFADRAIVPEPGHFERFEKPNSERFYPFTSAPAQAVTEWLNTHTGGDHWKAGAISLSPALLDYGTNQILGGVGSFASRVISAPVKLAQGKAELGDLADHGEIPFLRRVFGATPESATSQRYQDIENGALQAEARIKGLIASGDRDAAKAALKEDHDFLTALPLMKAADKELSSWRKMEAAIQASKTMSDADKNRKTLQVQQKMQDVKKAALKGYYTLQAR
jgi:hypothetical protein